jgi:drug/metabolite transporter (DMT)-like permease
MLKLATGQLSGLETSSLRFAVAAIFMLPWAWGASGKAWRDGGILGTLALLSYVAQAYGLEFISSNRSAFLTSLNVLMVPLIGIVLGSRLDWRVVVAAVLACAGIGLMSWDGAMDWVADAATVTGALFCAFYVIVLSQRSPHHAPRHLAATQIVSMGVLGLVWMLALASGTDAMSTLPGRLNVEIAGALVYMGIVATAGMLFLQASAQRYVSADKAAVIYAMEPVFAALFAWWWLSEGLTPRAALGGAIVVFAVVLSEWKPAER